VRRPAEGDVEVVTTVSNGDAVVQVVPDSIDAFVNEQTLEADSLRLLAVVGRPIGGFEEVLDAGFVALYRLGEVPFLVLTSKP